MKGSSPRAACVVSIACLLAGGGAGCGPCAGVPECTDASHVLVQGQLRESVTGATVSHATVRLVVHSGSGADSVVGVPDANGLFQLSAPALPGRRLDLVVAAADFSPYRIDDLPCPPSNDPNACVLGPISVNPQFQEQVELHYRTDYGRSTAFLNVEFHQTSGPAVRGPSVVGGVFRTTTDAIGRIHFFVGDTATGLDPVVGDLVVSLPAPLTTSTIHGFRIVPDYAFRPPPRIAVYGIGPSLGYYLLFFDQQSKAPVSGVTVVFRRTGGIALASDSISATSDIAGKAYLGLLPAAEGAVTGTLTITPPHGSVVVVPVSLPTFDSDDGQLLETWDIAPDGTLIGPRPGSGPP